MSDVLLVSGTGPYRDPWHDFDATSARLAHVLAGLGWQAAIAGDVEDALADPGDARLLVVNIGNPAEPRPPERLEAAAAGLHRHLAKGGRIMGVHSSSTSLTGMPEWPAILGGRWVRGASMHPPRGEFVLHKTASEHPITEGLTEITVDDEQYSYLETRPDVTVLYEHVFEDAAHPLVWAREVGGGKIVYSGLGHDVAAYDSPDHIELLQRAIEWLM